MSDCELCTQQLLDCQELNGLAHQKCSDEFWRRSAPAHASRAGNSLLSTRCARTATQTRTAATRDIRGRNLPLIPMPYSGVMDAYDCCLCDKSVLPEQNTIDFDRHTKCDEEFSSREENKICIFCGKNPAADNDTTCAGCNANHDSDYQGYPRP